MPRRAEPADTLAGPEGSRTVYLLDAASDYEARILTRWLAGQVGAPETRRIRSSRRRRFGEGLGDLLDEANVFLLPVRVVWMAPEKGGRRSVGWWDLLTPGDPRDPRGIRARFIRMFRPGRVRLIAGQGAMVTDLAGAYSESGEIGGLEAFVTRRAWRALDRVERSLRGNRYKIPRFVPESILSRGELALALERYAVASGRDPDRVGRTAARYLREIAATHSPYVIDLIANVIHWIYRQGYGGIRYSTDEVARLAELGTENPVVFLPSHRSNLDRLSLQFMLWENDLPPNHTAGGINLNFFPIGPLLRRTGVFFIRRSFRDNDLYKIVLRAYIDYLVEKRFPLEWYLEGGRSRSGKLDRPRLGLLNYVVDAVRRHKSDDVVLIPVSIAYDQIQDVPDYAREAQGRGKEKESLGWLFRALRSLRRRHGDIHIRFGDPVSVRAGLGGGGGSLIVPKLAFEVMYRIGRVTPITPTAVVCIVLLAARGKARTAAEIAEGCARLADFIEARRLPTTARLPMATSEVMALLDMLAEHDNVSSHEAVGRRVFWLDDTQMVRVSYYRNVVVHFFVSRAIAEMALTAEVEEGGRDLESVERRAFALRDLLKFEFFFPERGQFVTAISDDLEVDVPNWRETLAASGPAGVLAKMGDPIAYWAVLPFLDAYQIVGDELESWDGPFDEKRFLHACLTRARMYRIEERVYSGESASQVLFKSALALAANRGLLEPAADVEIGRARFADEVRAARGLAVAGL